MIPQPTESQVVAPGSTAISSVLGDPWIGTQITWRLINDADGTVMIAESGTGIDQVDTGEESPLVRYDRAFTVPNVAGRYLAIWRHVYEQQAQTFVVATSADASFATSSDVVTVLGRALTAQETSDVPGLLSMAASAIADAAGYDDGWALTLSPVPQRLRWMSAELVKRALVNRTGATSIRQQVGSYSYAATWDTVGMILSDAEVLMIRRAVHGRTTDSVHVDSGFLRAQDEYWLRMQQPVNSQAPGVTIE